MDDVFGMEWDAPQVEVMEALQTWAVAFAELNQLMSSWLDLPTTDANALGQVLWADSSGEPLSPARLGQRIGMTSGSVTVLLNRLESAGLVARSREHTDRRRVTLRPTPAARERARAFTEMSTAEIAAALQQVPAAELEHHTAFIRRMVGAASDAADRLRG
ncbi:MarR family winged helix-turn-helix transcriptional regulator [Curtobacterium flaccumfaciens]|uniref:MarR family winged helix-turn-helix transcriptional regulator n=1 Tax=Curtobacterium flaccumfaciens TaxID=2035 RepID=UPI00188C85A5|nr:MarR family transcriptional regulator [Curtobacterium flaccumfaciens]MBF4592891.1 MarR family transcriptional regulator [Curtobacterium flaccumfaciens]MBF4628298.1 MarR family transcriptional regulator [Curtobacterium flaccumfaciens]MBO9044839.1 MarR family transcriptional regulator [Curtobacterium flaccumfaciens pv. flaccumfaciens]